MNLTRQTIEYDPTAIGVTVAVAVAEVLKRAKAPPLLAPEKIRELKRLAEEWDALVEVLRIDVYAEARRLFHEQRERVETNLLSKDRTSGDSWTVEEFVSDLRSRVSVGRDKLSSISLAAIPLAREAAEAFALICKAFADDFEAKERSNFAAFGLNEFTASPVLALLRDLPRRVKRSIPAISNDYPMVNPSGMVAGLVTL